MELLTNTNAGLPSGEAVGIELENRLHRTQARKRSGAEKLSIISEARERYHKAGRKERGQILTALCYQFDYHRKHATRLMSTVRQVRLNATGKSRKPSNELLAALGTLRKVTGMQGARRLRVVIPEWLPSYQVTHPDLSPADVARLKKASHATLTRFISRLDQDFDPSSIRSSYAALFKPVSASMSLLKPFGLGHLFAQEVNLEGAESGAKISGLKVMDALSGWTVIVRFESSITDALEKVAAALPFKVQSLFLEYTAGEHGIAARKWAWERESAVSFCSSEQSTQITIRSSHASEHAMRCVNFGFVSVSPHAGDFTPYRKLQMSLDNLEALRRLEGECALLGESGQILFNELHELRQSEKGVECA